MKKKLQKLLEELKSKLDGSRKSQVFYSERQAGYAEGYETALEEFMEAVSEILPKESN